MKNLLLIAAILAIGSTAFAVSEGDSANIGFAGEDTMYTPWTISANRDSGAAGGFGLQNDITTNDNAVHNDGAVNIFRDKGEGWEDQAATHILLNVLEPIIIESEVDFLYTEAVAGDELQIGDIGFRVKGMGPAEVEFKFAGPLFRHIPTKATIKGFDGFYPVQTVDLGVSGPRKASQMVYLTGEPQEIEVDLYLDLTSVEPGLKFGVIVARAEYQ